MRDLRLILGLVRKREVLILCGLSALYAAAEGFSVALLLPIFQSIQYGSAIFDQGELPPHLGLIKEMTNLLRLPTNLASLLVLAFLAILVRQGFQFLRTTQGTKVQERVSASLKSRGFAALVHSDLGFLNARQQGRLHSVLVSDASRSGSVALIFLRLLGTLFLFMGYVILLLLLSPLLTLIAVAASALTFAAVRFVSRASWRHGQQISSLNGELNTTLIEKLAGVLEVKMANQEDREAGKVKGIAESLAIHMVRLRVLGAGLEATVEPMMIAAGFLILLLAVQVFGLPLANLVVFMFVLMRLIPLTREVNNSRQSISGHMASLVNATTTIAEAEASRRIVSGSHRFQRLESGIEFDRVSFTYSQNGTTAWALQDVSAVIPKGSFTALVGKSGAGKSTLVSLIPRLHDISSGQIRFDGIPIQEFTLESLRPAIGFVSQDVFLFNDTVYNNLIYGLSKVTREAVMDATRRAYAHQFIQELSEGYDTVLGDRGVRLSAGQRQRLSIARAMLQDPDILILDEPTSALDSESEAYIQEALADLSNKKTVIVIAHRLSTIQKADKILVLKEGRLVEQGDHSLLVKRNGTYKRLFDLQMIGG